MYTGTTSQGTLKALLNIVYTFKNLSCMALHARSVFNKMSKSEASENNCTSKAALHASKK